MLMRDALGLDLNESKSEIIILERDITAKQKIVDLFREVAPDIKITDLADFEVLGSPVGEIATMKKIGHKITELSTLKERISRIDAHDALFLLKNCLSSPKMVFLLRSSPCFSNDLLSQYDSVLRETLSIVVNSHLNDISWLQASLPTSFGGLGIRSAVTLSIPAFLLKLVERLFSDFSDISKYAPLKQCLNTWHTITENRELPSDPKVQKNWDHPLCQKQINDMHNGLDDENKIRIMAVSTKEASTWLNAFPISSLGLKLSDSMLRIAVALRLGTRVCAPFECKCGEMVAENGIHGLSCKNNKGNTFDTHF